MIMKTGFGKIFICTSTQSLCKSITLQNRDKANSEGQNYEVVNANALISYACLNVFNKIPFLADQKKVTIIII